jgi:hypothetical protein
MRTLILTLGCLAALVPAHAADLEPRVKVVPAPPPRVVEYPPVAVAPDPCGPIAVSPYGHSHCYGSYRPWRQPGCWWRHGVYVCPPVARLEEQGY